jgi:hypothetical protein
MSHLCFNSQYPLLSTQNHKQQCSHKKRFFLTFSVPGERIESTKSDINLSIAITGSIWEISDMAHLCFDRLYPLLSI